MDEQKALCLFKERATQLNCSRLVQNNFKSLFEINYDIKTGKTSLHANNPDEEDLKSFLIDFRHFISKKEPVFINRIYNICQKYLICSHVKRVAAESYKNWKEYYKNKYLKFMFDGKILSPEYVTNLWINGIYFHNDESKRIEIDKLIPIGKSVFKKRFLNHIVITSRFIFNLCDIVKYSFSNSMFNFERQKQ